MRRSSGLAVRRYRGGACLGRNGPEREEEILYRQSCPQLNEGGATFCFVNLQLTFAFGQFLLFKIGKRTLWLKSTGLPFGEKKEIKEWKSYIYKLSEYIFEELRLTSQRCNLRLRPVPVIQNRKTYALIKVNRFTVWRKKRNKGMKELYI